MAFFEKVGRLKTSPLARVLGLFFCVLLLVQSFFVVWLALDVWQAEQRAAHEYRLLSASQKISVCADLLRKHRWSVDYWRGRQLDQETLAMYNKEKADCLAASDDLLRAWKVSGLDPQSGQRLVNMIGSIFQASYRVIDPNLTPEIKELAHEKFRVAYENLYFTALAEITSIQKQINKLNDSRELAQNVLNKNDSSFGVDLLLVLALSLVINIVFGVFIAVWSDRNISSRLIRIAQMCDGLKQGRIMDAPKENRNELDSLQKTFHDMSIFIVENEKSRRSYIELLKNMQSASLIRAQAVLQSLEEKNTANPKAHDRFQMLRITIGGMIHLLETMAEGLQFNADAKIVPDLKELNTTDLMRQASVSIQALIDKKKMKLKINDPQLAFNGDPHYLNRVIVNLLSNAIKFSAKETSVELVAMPAGDNIRFEIRDSGPGISADDQKKLFKAFSQVGSDGDAKRSGSGLGLMICKQIIEAHSGEIGCSSELGKGTTFWFYFPRNLAPQVENAVASAAASPASEQHVISKGIKGTFIVSVLLFSIAQAALAFGLGYQIVEVNKRAQTYFKQQTLVLETEHYLATFLTWRAKAAAAMGSQNRQLLKETYPLLLEERDLSDKLAKMTESDKDLQTSFLECRKRFNYLVKAGRKVLDEFDDMPTLQVANLVHRAEVIGLQIEDLMFAQMRGERKDLERSYDMADRLRNELIPIILLTGFANAALIGWLAFFVLTLIDRTAQLSAKTQEFVSGGSPIPSLTGTDELAYLDKHLCVAAFSIRNAERQRRQLLSIVNHDLRTPLASVLGGLEIVKAGILGDLDPSSTKLIDDTEREMRVHLNQINNLLTLEQCESGSLDLRRDPVYLSDALEDAVMQAKTKWQGSVNLDFDVEEPGENMKVLGEVNLLTRIFNELIENAAKANLQAHSSDPVDVRMRVNGQKLCVLISDSGTGIPGELRSQLFDRFRTLNSQACTGMGLPMAERLIKLHGADITIQDGERKGTTAVVVFDACANGDSAKEVREERNR